MKKIIYSLLIVTIAFYSCSDQLNLDPKSFINGDSYFGTEASIKLALNGAYSDLQILFNTSGGMDFWAVSEMRTDNTSFQYNPSDRGEFDMEFLDTFSETASDDDLQRIWDRLYSGISHCNTVLSRIDNIDFKDPSLKDQYTGEAEFLRAYYYYNLVRLWGGVPLVLEEVRSPAEAFSKGRSSIDSVYDQIINDIKDATSKLPLKYNGVDVGRVTKGAVYTMLGEIYMTLKDYPSAIEALSQVINMDYSLLPDYGDIFDPAHKNNSESIFEIQFNASLDGEASEFAYRFVPFNSGSTIIGFNNLAPGHAGYNIPTLDMLNAYEKSDKRMAASVGYYVNPENTQYDVAIGDSIPYVKKFVHPFDQPSKTNENWPVYRFSQVLLMMAEALNETGQTAAAYPYINEVRNRAGLASLTSGMNQLDFKNTVYHEERVELAFENHRWFDLLRTDRALEVMTKHGVEEKKLKPRLTSSDFDIQEYKLLYPIPQREVRVNHLVQNPGR